MYGRPKALLISMIILLLVQLIAGTSFIGPIAARATSKSFTRAAPLLLMTLQPLLQCSTILIRSPGASLL